MATKSRRTTRRTCGGSKNKALKIAAIVALPFVALGTGGYGLNEYMKIEQISADYCYERADQAETAVFLDYSVNKDLSGAQRRDLVTALERAYAQTSTNGRIMLFTTARDTSGSLADPVFQICRPAANAAEQAAIGAPSKTVPNLRHIAEEAGARYRAQIMQILEDTQDSAKAAQESPILEQVQAISRYAAFQGSKRSFVWLSDGIQNSEFARFGAVKGDMPSVARFVQRPDYDVVTPESFAGANVTLLLVESIALPQAGLEFVTHSELRTWWKNWFLTHDAARVQLDRLRRVNGS